MKLIWIIILFLQLLGCSSTSLYETKGAHSVNRPQRFGNSQKFQTKERPDNVNYFVCSYYGEKFHGKQTSNGEIYDMNKLTCAHKTLPFGTRLRITNEDNGKSVVVRVNDRGPFVKGRDLDLSKAAAEKIGLIPYGVKKLRVEFLDEKK